MHSLTDDQKVKTQSRAFLINITAISTIIEVLYVQIYLFRNLLFVRFGIVFFRISVKMLYWFVENYLNFHSVEKSVFTEK